MFSYSQGLNSYTKEMLKYEKLGLIERAQEVYAAIEATESDSSCTHQRVIIDSLHLYAQHLSNRVGAIEYERQQRRVKEQQDSSFE